VKALLADKAFVARFLSGDGAAKQMFADAHRVAAGEPATAAPSALERIDQLKSDATFRQRLADGDAAAVQEWKEANQAAFPEGAASAAAEIDQQFPPAAAEAFDLTGIFSADHPGNTINPAALEAEKTMRGLVGRGAL
jgi:hypothetical protein